MSKSISKSEAVRVINAADALELLLESIDRDETPSSKQSKLNGFIRDIQKQINEQRDIKIIAVKLK